MPAVTMYTSSLCPFCYRAKALLNKLGASFEEINIEKQPEKMAEMLERSNGARSVPQIFIGDKHVGGSDDLAAMHRAGDLDGMFD